MTSNHFDHEFPIDLSRRIEGLTAGVYSLSAILNTVKEGIPFNFRYRRAAELHKHQVSVDRGDMTVDEIFRLLATSLPFGWKISALVGWSIMYDDGDRKYPSAFRYYRPDGVVEQKPETRRPSKRELDDETEESDESEALF